MDPVDAIGMALTPGTPFNQQNKVFRSAKALAQFAGEGVDQGDVLALVAENLADRVTIRPSAKRPENGPLIALTEYIPQQEEGAVQVKIVGGNAVVEGAPPAQEIEALEAQDGDQALMEKVAEMTGAPVGALEEDEMPGVNDPDDEEVA